MSATKINSFYIKQFRGITDQLLIDFTMNKTAESVLIFGDNGSGKSSVIDALEYVTRGTIHTSSSVHNGDWLYNSISYNKSQEAFVEIKLNTSNVYSATLKKTEDDKKILKKVQILPMFRRAPFILRRQDVLRFWELPNVQKLRIFLPYEYDVKKELLVDSREKVNSIERERERLKIKKRGLIDDIAKYYNFEPEEYCSKKKDVFFAHIRELNGGVGLKKLQSNHPMRTKLKELNKIYDNILKKNAELKEAKKGAIEDQVEEGQKERLKRVMKEISPIVTEKFRNISRTNNFVKDIEITVAERTEVSLEFSVFLDSEVYVDPVMIFSEANRDLLALLIYFEYIYDAGKGDQAQVLVLDDIFQSIDATIRFRVMQYVIDRFADWQIIITTHDRLWKEQLTLLFRNHAKPLQQLEIVKWTLESGPKIIGGVNCYDEKLLLMLEKGSTADICASAGYLLEYMCDKLSVILETSIKRKSGDRYTIGDLWPGIFKVLKNTEAGKCFGELNDLVGLRNIVGSHYNEWSLALARNEAEDFGRAVLEAYYHVFCKESGKWIKGKEDITDAYYIST